MDQIHPCLIATFIFSRPSRTYMPKNTAVYHIKCIIIVPITIIDIDTIFGTTIIKTINRSIGFNFLHHNLILFIFSFSIYLHLNWRQVQDSNLYVRRRRFSGPLGYQFPATWLHFIISLILIWRRRQNLHLLGHD